MKVNRTLSLITFPLLTGLIALAPEFVHNFYGEEWQPVVVPMQILCVVGAIRSIMHNNGTIFYTRNRPDLAFKWGVIQMFTIPIPLIIGSMYGLSGVSLALLIIFIGYFMYIQNVINSLLEINFIEYVKIFSKPFLFSIAMALGVFLIKSGFKEAINMNDLFVLMGGAAIGGLFYLTFLRFFDNTTWAELKSLPKLIFSNKGV